MLIDCLIGEEVVGMAKLCIPKMDMRRNEEAVAVDFVCGVVVDGREVVLKELGDDSVWSSLGGEKCTDKLRIILKICVRKMVRGEEGERRSGEVIVDLSGGGIATVLAASGGWESRR